MAIQLRSYLSPTLVLLAFDWKGGKTRPDFLGFAIKRVPGFRAFDGQSREPESWLPNRITFDGPVPAGQPDAPSDKAPIQKFMWWDARIDEEDRNGQFVYMAFPVTGTADAPVLLEDEAATCQVTLPDHMVDGIGTWFNRAVLSSQAFSRKLAAMGLSPTEAPPPEKALALREWLANDLQKVFGEVLDGASRVVGATYHLTDRLWAIPLLEAFAKADNTHRLELVYDSHRIAKTKTRPEQPSPNQSVVDELGSIIRFSLRDKTGIMHNKFLVSDGKEAAGRPERVLMGSANFTMGGLTTQANLLHIFDSPELARLYSDRADKLSSNPTKAKTAALSQGWSSPIAVGAAWVRACFSPEPKGKRQQIDTVVKAIGKAKRSVLFCIFTPTDKALRDACFAAGDRGLMMFGIVNNISSKSARAAEKAMAVGTVLDAAKLANMQLFHRSKTNKDVIDGAHFSRDTTPEGFEPELTIFPGDVAQDFGSVVIHHKFIVIDAEGRKPLVYSGSANMSENSEHNNDENLVEIRDARVAAVYLAEFLRLYEHYRARAISIEETGKPQEKRRLALQRTRKWADKYFKDGSPEAKARIAMAN
ncbi:phospholipase D-like domain-containing protein [Variovorax sp. GT1P44]|uniref:phospholipase D-like domain-containing protein n=1 Tax=Variovorax sp. GT1P44 TaxID=3443742 RepID=UPI003F44CF77